MLVFSYSALILTALFCAVLPYRQPAKLDKRVRSAASMISLSCLFIAAAAISSVSASYSTTPDGTLWLMLQNMQHYLAIPLWCTALGTLCWPKYFSKGTWGRWSLVLLATFELCRRAQVSDYYIAVLVFACMLAITLALVIKPLTKVVWINVLGVISLGCALMLFWEQFAFAPLGNIIYYNFSLAIALISATFGVTRALPLSS